VTVASEVRLQTRPVVVPADRAALAGDLTSPPTPRGLVLFAHGSGSSRHSPRNRYVADVLNNAGLATLLVDLLTEEEDELDRRTRELRFDIALLAERVLRALDWLATDPATRELAVGIFGASTGAAAALAAAASRPDVRAVVSRGGRPDLAGGSLLEVRTPTLLLVGGADTVVLDLNREAIEALAGPSELVVVPGASHLFEEPGALEEVARLARDWFARFLGRAAGRGREN
jgi:putative phosphoribosyl transferase